jgi:hypothetical protein
VIAVLLGVGRRCAEQLGWSPALLVGWEYFVQLQTIAAMNATLAVGILASLRLLSRQNLRVLVAATCAIATAVLAPLALQWMFKNVGAEYHELVGLFIVESIVLLATLVPLQLAERADNARTADTTADEHGRATA